MRLWMVCSPSLVLTYTNSYQQTLNGTNTFTLLLSVELVRVAMAAAEGKGHTATNIMIVVPSGDWDTAWSRVHSQCAYTYNTIRVQGSRSASAAVPRGI